MASTAGPSSDELRCATRLRRPRSRAAGGAIVLLLVSFLSGCSGGSGPHAAATVGTGVPATSRPPAPLRITAVPSPTTHRNVTRVAVPVGTPDRGVSASVRYSHVKAIPSTLLARSLPSDISMPWILLHRHGASVDVLFVGGAGRCVVPVGHRAVTGAHAVELVMVSRRVSSGACAKETRGTAVGKGATVLRARFYLRSSRGLTLLHAPVSAHWTKTLAPPKQTTGA